MNFGSWPPDVCSGEFLIFVPNMTDSDTMPFLLFLERGCHMATYKRLKDQIAALEKRAEQQRKVEAAKVIVEIKALISRFDLRVDDLFEILPTAETVVDSAIPASVGAMIATQSKPTAPERKAKVSPAKYMDPKTQKTWSGHGKPPAWISQGKRDDFLIENVLQKISASTKNAAVKKSATTTARVTKAAPKEAEKKAAPAKKPTAIVPTKKKVTPKATPKGKAVTKASPRSSEKKTAPAKKSSSVASKVRTATPKKAAPSKNKTAPVTTAAASTPNPSVANTASPVAPKSVASPAGDSVSS